MGDAVIEGYINNNKKMILLHLHHLKIIFNSKVIIEDVKISKSNKIMNQNHPMKSKRFRQKERTLKIYTEPQEV